MIRHSWFGLLLVAGCGRIGFDDGDSGSRAIATAATGFARIEDVALRDDGTLLLLGPFDGTLEINGANTTSVAAENDLYVASLDRDDRMRWLWTAGCTTICNAQGVAWVGERAVAGGYFAGTLTRAGDEVSGPGQDALVMWFEAGGAVEAAEHFGGSANVQIRGLEVAESVVAVGGVYADTVDFGGGEMPATANDNGFVAAFDAADRSPRYAYSYNGSGDVWPNDLAVAPDGSVCVVGRMMTTTDFGGGPVSPASVDAFVVRYDAAGAYVWHQVSRGPGNETASKVTALTGGDCVVAGFYTTAFTWDGKMAIAGGGQDMFVARFDAATGAIRWLQAAHGPAFEGPIGIASRGDRIAVAGNFGETARVFDRDMTSDGLMDAFLVTLDGDGTPLASHHLGGSGDAGKNAGGMSFDPRGANVALGFSYRGELLVRDLGLQWPTTTTESGAVFVVSTPR